MRNPLYSMSAEDIQYTGFCVEWYRIGLELFRKSEVAKGSKFMTPINSYEEYRKFYTERVWQ